MARPYTPTALPSVTARLLAFVAILIGGLSGGLIGWSVADLQCGGGDAVVVLPRDADEAASTTLTTLPPAEGDEGCTTIAGLGGLGGAVIGAGGVAIVAVLVLRAMAEWRKELVEEDLL